MRNDPRRFLYVANAIAISGRLLRPSKIWLGAGASALPVEGGKSEVTLKPGKGEFGGVVGFGRASTHAQGVPHKALPGTGRRAAADPTSHAHAGAEVQKLFVGRGVRMTAARVRAELTALCPCAALQPSIGHMEGAFFEGITFGRHRLSVTINRKFFQTHDTHDKLCALCDATRGRALPRAVLSAPSAQRPSRPAARTEDERRRVHDDHDGYHAPILTTIVKNLRWVGRPYPRSTVDGHTVSIPGFGQVYFGEMVITGPTRRLTMLRFELDGDVVLRGACCEVEAGGSWQR